MGGDLKNHAGDIAVLKMDSVGMRAYANKQSELRDIDDPAPSWDPDSLLKLPSDTFGHIVGAFLKRNRLEPLRLTDEISPSVRKRNVYGIRVAATHDLVHVLTGFDTSWPGEMGVYAFQHGQRWSKWSRPLVIVSWVFYPFLNKGDIKSLIDAYRKGRRQGQRAPFLLAEDLEGRFEEPLEKLRHDYNIET